MREKKRKGENNPPWLVLVYMATNAPNLQQPLGLDLEELGRPLREFGQLADDAVDVIVQVDAPSGVSKRFKLRSNGSPACLDVRRTSDTTLRDFIVEASRGYEKSRRALVVWGHASGVGRGLEAPGQASFQAQANAQAIDAQDVAPAAVPAEKQPNPADKQLRGSAEAGAVWRQIADVGAGECPPHIVGFDACHMASIEVAAQLHGHAEYLLAPQADIGLEGWHYDLLLDSIVAHQHERQVGISAPDLGRRVVKQVGLTASSPDALTLLDLGRTADVTQALIDLVQQLESVYGYRYREAQARHWLYDAFHETAWAKVRQFLDLADLCRLLASRVPSEPLRQAARGVLAQLVRRDGFILDHLCTLKQPLAGVSIYCPWPRATARLARLGARNVEVDQFEYLGLQLQALTISARSPGWGQFVFGKQALQDAERRWVRDEARDRADDVVAVLVDGRVDGPKPSGREPGPKPAERAAGAKPATRGADIREGSDDWVL